MATNWNPRGTEWRRLLIVAGVVLAVIGVAVLVGAQSAEGATASVTMGNLTMSGTNQSVDGTVTDVGVNANLKYRHDVSNADRRTVELLVGTNKSNVQAVTFKSAADPQANTSGTLTLSGSLLNHPQLSAANFRPPTAGDVSTTVVVGARITVTRADGPDVTRTVLERTTVTFRDGDPGTATIGGTMTVTVTTDE